MASPTVANISPAPNPTNGAGNNAPVTNAAPSNQTPGHPSFRRQRASRACETCHSRKVRCDAASLGVPCTNCVAFSIECKIPAPKRKKASTKPGSSSGNNGTTAPKEEDSDIDPALNETTPPPVAEPASATSQATPQLPKGNANLKRSSIAMVNSDEAMPPTSLSQDQLAIQTRDEGSYENTYKAMMKPRITSTTIKESGRVAYLGESSNLSLLVSQSHGVPDVVHYPLPDTVKGSKARLTELDNIEIDILHQRGAFLLPPRALCDELVNSFFKWVAPVVPVINKSRFMKRYRDNKNPPSLLLLQAVLLAGSRVCTNSHLMDANGSTMPAAMTFYKRAKALYDAGYEDDRVTIVQALVLMGWYWEGPEDVTKNVFYWSRVAIIVAQGSGMHRSVEGSALSLADKRLWKRIWWTLFTRDRSVAVALGRPVSINTDDSDVEMITEDDFIEDDGDQIAEYPPDQIHMQFFLQYVRLCEIMGLVLSQQYSVASKMGRQNAMNLMHSDMALADWLRNCPEEMQWEQKSHHFWAALLQSNYYTTLCLLHRAHMPPAMTANAKGPLPADAAYPSRDIAFNAARMITTIVATLQQQNELHYAPAFIVYSLFSALIMHVYQVRSKVQTVVNATHERMHTCMEALKEVSKVWLVAKMVYTLFVSVLSNKQLEERLQKAAGRKHKKVKTDHVPDVPASALRTTAQQQNQQAQDIQAAQIRRVAQAQQDATGGKVRLEDMALGFGGGHPAQQVSFERSRPQSPVMSPSRDTGAVNNGGFATPANPAIRPNTNVDPFVNNAGGATGANTRANNTRSNTPFISSYSVPATPPDLYLVTRGSPTISWMNYDPAQLFPEAQHLNFDSWNMNTANNVAGTNTMGEIDPALQMPNLTTPTMASYPQQQGQQTSPSQPKVDGSGMPMEEPVVGGGLRGFGPSMSPDDTWSNSSKGAPPVPTTLNVEDWFQFFGMQGDGAGFGNESFV